MLVYEKGTCGNERYSNFQYCPLIWLFCSKAADYLINGTTKRAMRIIYNNDNEEALDALLQRDRTLAIHKNNLQKTNGGNI